MNTKQVISLLSHVREKANKFIIQEMSQRGITGIVPSHGDIIVELLKQDRLTMKELAQRIDRDNIPEIISACSKLHAKTTVVKIEGALHNDIYLHETTFVEVKKYLQQWM